MDTLQEMPEDDGTFSHVQPQIDPKYQIARQSPKPGGA